MERTAVVEIPVHLVVSAEATGLARGAESDGAAEAVKALTKRLDEQAAREGKARDDAVSREVRSLADKVERLARRGGSTPERGRDLGPILLIAGLAGLAVVAVVVLTRRDEPEARPRMMWPRGPVFGVDEQNDTAHEIWRAQWRAAQRATLFQAAGQLVPADDSGRYIALAAQRTQDRMGLLWPPPTRSSYDGRGGQSMSGGASPFGVRLAGSARPVGGGALYGSDPA